MWCGQSSGLSSPANLRSGWWGNRALRRYLGSSVTGRVVDKAMYSLKYQSDKYNYLEVFDNLSLNEYQNQQLIVKCL